MSLSWAGALAADGPTNRLIHETSPYLRQHAHDPVDWYAWGDEAFARARAEGRPVFVSIGYSTCHWCHEMARECFADAEVARLLNEHFICIKVDREARPDLDRIYMAFVQASTGSGGWPLSVWLTPELRPFFGGTYFPREDEGGRPGFKTVLARITRMWSEQPARIREQSESVAAALQEAATVPATEGALAIGPARTRAVEHALASYDAKHGGFDTAPKFAQPMLLAFLLDVAATSPDAAQRDTARRLALDSLHAIAAGGIHDHLDGGFHRYAVDAGWRLPHFEKMLYDQALLADAYLTASRLTGDREFLATTESTLDFVLRRLAAPDGGFFAAVDADSALPDDPSKHAEGACYVWTEAEIDALLGPDDAPLFAYAYGVEPGGNIDPAIDGNFAGKNVLHRAHDTPACAQQFAIAFDAVAPRLAAARARLLAARDQRPSPARDDKIITAWNGLMISALARTAAATGEARWLEAAIRAAQFARDQLADPVDGRLARSHCDGRRGGPGFAEDYSSVIQGLLDLHEATLDVRWLEWATLLQEKQIALFWDEEGGGFFATTSDDASVLLRLKDSRDGVEPAATSLAVRNLARLSELLHRPAWREQAARAARAVAPSLEAEPGAMPELLAALGWLEAPPQRIVICGEPDPAKPLIDAVRQRHLPRHVLLRVDAASRGFLEGHDSLIAAYSAGESAMAYVCANFACEVPTADPGELGRQLDRTAVTRR